MSNLSINNVQNAGVNGVNEINFKGKSKEYNADNKESNNEGMKTTTKLMIGATALATAVVGGLALAKKGKLPNLAELKTMIKPAEEKIGQAVTEVEEQVVESAQKTGRKNPLNMTKTELGEWGEKTADKLKKLFGKKRDMTKWENIVDKEHGIVRKDSSYQLMCKDGKMRTYKLKTEIITSPSGKRLYKDYDLQGNLHRVYYTDTRTGLSHTINRRPNHIGYSVTDAHYGRSPKINHTTSVNVSGIGKRNKNLCYTIDRSNSRTNIMGHTVSSSNELTMNGQIPA